MKTDAKAITRAYRTPTAFLLVHDPECAFEFYKRALGAKERMCQNDPRRRIRYCEIEIGSSVPVIGGLP